MLGVRRFDKVCNECVTELCDGKKGVNVRINESDLKLYDHMETMNDS